MQKKTFRPALLRIPCYLFLFTFFAFLPLELLEGPPTCPTKILLGFDCPGCGATHAFALLMKGRFASAFGENAVFTCLIFPILALVVLQDTFYLLFRADTPSFLSDLLHRGKVWLKGKPKGGKE